MMKIKLIQSGGFIGKLKSAEEDLTNYPDVVNNYFENNLTHSKAVINNDNKSPYPDSFEYHLEYKGKLLNINDMVFPKEVQQIIDKLKDNLHY